MLSIQVSPSLDEKEGSDSSVYQCPLFVNSQMPRYQSIWRGYAKVDEPSSQQQPILEIQLNSGEDADDCRMFEIALYSCPLWARPHL